MVSSSYKKKYLKGLGRFILCWNLIWLNIAYCHRNRFVMRIRPGNSFSDITKPCQERSNRFCSAPGGMECLNGFQNRNSTRLFVSISVFIILCSVRMMSRLLDSLNDDILFTQCSSQVHFRYSIESLLSCDIPKLKSNWFTIYARLKFGWKVTSDCRSYFLIKLVINILIKHWRLTDRWFSDNTEFDYDILLHVIDR